MLTPFNNPIPAPTPGQEQALRALTFDANPPGPILHDFETLLDYVGEAGVAVSAREHRLKPQAVLALNERLSHPLPDLFKRPQQKSYPYVHGLYLVLRASGLSYTVQQGRTHHLRLDEAAMQSWDTLNPTEQYFTLFFAWLLRADEESIMGSGHRSPFTNLNRCHEFLNRMSGDALALPSYKEQEDLRYYPGFYNLALMDLFGLVSLEEGEPETGKGWRVARVQRHPFALPLLNFLTRLQLERFQSDDFWLEEDPTLKIEDVQEGFQLYFPAWRRTLAVPGVAFAPGLHVFKVSLGKVWRRMALPATLPLDDLAFSILGAFDFEDWEHLYQFTYQDAFGQVQHINHEYAEEPPFTKDVRIGDLPIRPGGRLTFVFDFGDWWEFDLALERIDPDDPETTEPVLMETHGNAPSQYPDYDEYE